MTCKVIPSWNLEGNDPPKGNPAKIERRTSYIFIPHKWVVKLGMRKMLAFSSQVRPMNINVYKIRPDTFTIFEYCRNGNFDGVKSLLKLGQASIKDINEFGETPLHLAASWCQTEICTLLLDAGADTTLVDLRGSSKTPFHRACCPGEEREANISYHQQIATLRLFISRGEDLSNAMCLSYLMDYDSRYGDEQETRTAMTANGGNVLYELLCEDIMLTLISRKFYAVARKLRFVIAFCIGFLV
ncbi:hypothetical protein WAI453_011221 [Rhynchosporium graminicola]